jgi:hypothetical protein
MQQRVLAVNTLARVIQNVSPIHLCPSEPKVQYIFHPQARSGSFHEMLSSPIIPSLLDSGFVFILRWALDDSTENSMVAAINALHALLVCMEDEVKTFLRAIGVFVCNNVILLSFHAMCDTISQSVVKLLPSNTFCIYCILL